MKILLTVIAAVIIIAAIGYAKFYLYYVVPNPTLSTLFGPREEKTILKGIIIHNPIRDAYKRGTESYCWDNQLASHLLELEVKVENQDNPPRYLREAWSLFNTKELVNKNVLPIFIIKRDLSNFFGFFWEKILAKFEGKNVQVEGSLVVHAKNTDQECRTFLVDSVSLIKN